MRQCLTCGELTEGSYCRAHRPDNQPGRRDLRGWSKLRREILERDGYLCQLKLKPCLVVADTVDHVIPRARGGADVASNLQAACGPCNALKGARVLA